MSRILFTLYFVLIAIVSPAAAADLPDVFDLRDINGHSYIGPARDQGDCGGCYAFGALAAAESTYNRSAGLVDDDAVDLSESFILWDLSPYYEGFSGCEGTNYDYEELSGILAYGVVTESEFPYTYPDPEEENDQLDTARTPFSEWYRIPPNDIETMKRVIYTFGALDAAVYVDKAFDDYSGGVFENSTQSVTEVLPYTTDTDHAIAIVGWNDADGTWYLRNSWGEDWGEDGYMNIAYTSANVALEATYLTIGDWAGSDVTYENDGSVTAQPYTSGGVLNANAVDIWTGAKSQVINSGTLTASAVSGEDMTTARGIYLWGGPEGFAANSGTIDVTAQSDTAQAIAYGISMQGSGGENSGTISALAASDETQALAYGIQVFNGSSAISLANSGSIASLARGDDGWAYGIWADSRSSVSITNSGTVSADGGTASIGLLLSGNGVNHVVNTGTIQASSDAMQWAIGIACAGQTDIVNTGIIDAGDDFFGMAVYELDTASTTRLTLGTGSDLTGRVYLKGEDDTLELTGEGTENSSFSGVENLVMNGTDWTLTAWFWLDPFENLTLTQGNLTLTAPVEISESGSLSGSGTLAADVTNSGRVSPGNSVGTLTIDGDYTQTDTATMALEAGGGTSDLLAVTGTAEIQGGGLILSASGYLTTGTYEFLTARTLEGSFDTLTTPAIFEADVTADPSGSLSLSVVRNTYESLALTPDQAGLASALDASWPLAAGEMADMLTQIDNMAELSSVRSALADLAPGFHSAVTTAALDNAVARTDRIRQHLYEALPQSRDQDREPGLNKEKNPWQFWAAGTALNRRYDQTPESPEVRAWLDGIFFGLDRRIGTGLAIGAAGAYSRTDVHDMNGASTATVDSFTGYLYATLNRAGFHAQALAGLGLDQYETDRAVPFLGRTASSKYKGWQASALLGGGYDWTPGGWTLGPVGSVQYLYLEGGDFSEEGAGGADLHLDSMDSKAWLTSLGFRAVRPILLEGKKMILPGIRAEWLHALSQDTDPLSATFPATGQVFEASAREPKEDLFKLDLSLTAVLTPNISARIHYLRLIQGNGGYTAHQAGVGVKVLF